MLPLRILVLSKRHYMAKDLLSDAYGRFFHIPEGLAQLGHEVQGLAADYYGKRMVEQQQTTAGVIWASFPVSRWQGCWAYWRALRRSLREFRPDVIWVASDAFHVIFGAWLQRSYGIPVVADLYDHFEAYRATQLPGITPLFRRALRHCVGVSCVSVPLANWVNTLRRTLRRGEQLPNALDNSLVSVLENALETPPFPPAAGLAPLLPPTSGKRYLGTAGALTKERGIEVFYAAAVRLQVQHPDWQFVVAGPRNLPVPAGILDLGQLPTAEIPALYLSLEVGVICNQPSLFAEYCFPQKLYEMLACGLPVVAAQIGVMAEERAWPGKVFGYRPNDVDDLVQKITDAMRVGRQTLPLHLPTWADKAKELAVLLTQAAQQR